MCCCYQHPCQDITFKTMNAEDAVEYGLCDDCQVSVAYMLYTSFVGYVRVIMDLYCDFLML